MSVSPAPQPAALGPGLFALLVAMSGAGPLALNIFIPSMPGLQSEFHTTYGTIQLTLTLYLLGLATCQLIYGPLSDRFGRRPIVLVGLSIFVAASLLASVSTSIHMLVAARLLQAVGGAAGVVLARTIVRDLFESGKAASVIGYITMAFVLAPMVAPTLGGLLEHVASWRASFWLISGIGALVLAAAWLALPETNRNRGASSGPLLLGGFAHLLGQPRFRGYAVTLAFASSVFFAFLAGAPYVTIVLLGRSPLEYGAWSFLISGGYMAGNFLAGRYSQRFGNDRMVTFGNLLTLTGCMSCLAAMLLGSLTPAALFIPMTLAGMGNGLTIPNALAGAIDVNPATAGAGAGLAGCIQIGFGAAVSQAVGTVQGDWPMAVIWCMAAGSALAALSHARRHIRDT